MQSLVSVNIIELDINNDVLIAWTYPTLTKSEKEEVVQKCQLTNQEFEEETLFARIGEKWVYYFFSTHNTQTKTIPKVKKLAVCVLTTDFNPEKYLYIAEKFNDKYVEDGNPVNLLKSYISLYATSSCKDFEMDKFNQLNPYLESPISSIISLFKTNFMMIWAALFMKKNVVVYSNSYYELLTVVRSLPLLVMHRQNWNILQPYVQFEENQIDYLKSQNGYIAGFTDPQIKNQENLYDLFIDVTTSEISIPEHAQGDIIVTKTYQQLAEQIFKAVESKSQTDERIIKALNKKNKELILNLVKNAGDSENPQKISLSSIKNLELSRQTEIFVINVASAENLLV
ncbi:hypothetical protein M0813_06841 [Anaeramoeba flamelloides]|uniref:UDENN domain-containing protein n=1 Tax=Anaeramoeba flamelloides TaxID=1746091 RepID=A0ABQ8XC07_9EUKA|nr:hypothetical protein M0813_06841 [Anaeramoeba flamelloides]